MPATTDDRPTDEKVLDVRPIPPRQKHPTIFETFDALDVGDYFVLVNDHDPVPLKHQFAFEREGQMHWECQSRVEKPHRRRRFEGGA